MRAVSNAVTIVILTLLAVIQLGMLYAAFGGQA